MSTMTIAINLVAGATGRSAFTTLIQDANHLTTVLSSVGRAGKGMTPQLLGAAAAAGILGGAFKIAFDTVKSGVEDAANLQEELVRLELASKLGADAFDNLKMSVIDLGTHSLYSTTEAAQAFEKLSEMGFSASQTMYGMGAADDAVTAKSYDAAAALQGVGRQAMAVGEAMKTDAVTGATLLGSALHTFQHDSLTAADAANILVGTFYAGVPSAEDLQMAISNAGAMADAAGISFHDFSTVLGMLAQSGLPASQAGTSLRYMIQSLIAPTDKQKTALKDLGLVTLGGADGFKVLSSKMFDAKGNFVGLGDAIGLLDTAMATKGLSMQQKMDIITQLFNVRSGRAAQILTNLDDFKAAYAKEWDAIGNVNALSNAQQIMATFNGSVTVLSTSIQSALADAFLPLIQAITPLIQGVNNLIGVFLNLNPQIQGLVGFGLILITALLGIGAAVAAAIAIFGILNGVLAGGVVAVLGSTLALLGPIALGIAAVAAVVALLVLAWQQATTKGGELNDAFKTMQDRLAPLGDKLGGLADFLNQGWTSAFSTAKQDVKDLGKELKDSLEGGAQSAADSMSAPNGLLSTLAMLGLATDPNNKSSVTSNVKASSDAIEGLGKAVTNSGDSFEAWQDKTPAWQQALSILAVSAQQAAISIETSLIGIAANIGAGMINGIMNLFPGLANALFGLGEFIAGIFQLIFAVLVADTGQEWDNWTSDSLHHIQDGGARLLQGLGQVFNGIYYGLIGWVPDVFAFLVTAAMNAMNGVAEHFNLPAIFDQKAKDAVDAMRKRFDSLPGLIQTIGDTLNQVLNTAGQHAISTVSGWSDSIRQLIQQLIQNAINTLMGFPGQIQNIFSKTSSNATAAIAGLPSKVGATMSATVAQATSHLLGPLETLGRNAGNGLINNLIGSLAAGLGRLASMANQIASIVAGPLHHSVPDFGPLAHDDQWGAEFIDNWVNGMQSRVGAVQSAALRVAGALSGTLTTPGLTGLSGLSVQGTGGNVVIPIYLDGKQIAQYTVNTMTKQIRATGASRYAK